MTAVTPGREALEPCPFCAKPLYITSNKINPSARCVTPDCYGTRMSVVNLDDPEWVKSWNTRLAVKPADDGQAATIEECRSIFEGVKNVLDFAIGLAWDAERLIPNSEPKRLRNMLNNIRQGYLKPAAERLSALPPSTTGEPKP